MVPGTDTSPYFTALDGGVCKENVFSMEDEDREASENSGQAKIGKPPRNISVMRHSMSQAMLPGTAELVSEFCWYRNYQCCVWFL